jgi:GPH family glycoside/pentoside/hexuronide:cation symporter
MNVEKTNVAVVAPPEADVRPSFWTKLVYGSGLDARLASVAALVGVIWDAINDPLVGALSDRAQTRWGRRRPFLLFATVPFGLSFLLLWWAPPWESQISLMIHITLAYMISDTIQTLVAVPFYALTPEITPDYDERTSLTGYRMIFNLIASIVTAMAAPMIQDEMLKAGFTLQQGYLASAALFGGLAIPPFLIMFFVVREQATSRVRVEQPPKWKETAATLWANIPFRFAALLYMLNWITFDLVALTIPFFLVYWVASGDLLASTSLFGMELSLESAVLGVLLIVALLAVPLWTWLSRRFSKRRAYIGGMIFWVVVEMLIFVIQPGQVDLVLVLAILAGISVSVAHVLPDAIFPDVIEWDELKTNRRHEGIYYGSKNFIRKLTGAFAIFFALQVLGWFEYQPPPEGVTQFSQSALTLTAIRVLMGPVGALLLLASVAAAWFYPLTRERHARIRRLLAKRQELRSRSKEHHHAQDDEHG